MTTCSVCKNDVPLTFLEKPVGTHVKDEKGKLYLVCFECQKKLRTKEEILNNIH